MNFKKILILSLVALAILSSLSVASAGFLDGLFGSSQNNITNISDLQFNVPDGYVLDNDSMNYENEIGWYMSDGIFSGKVVVEGDDYSMVPDDATLYNESCMNYIDESTNNTILISILHPFKGDDWTDDSLELNKTINGVEGEFEQDDDGCAFTYVKDGSKILIEAADEDTIANVIVNN